MPGQQAIQQGAERIHVGGGGGRFAAQLLGTRGVECDDAREFGGLVQCQGAGALRIDELGDAEIQQLGLALGRDQYVG